MCGSSRGWPERGAAWLRRARFAAWGRPAWLRHARSGASWWCGHGQRL